MLISLSKVLEKEQGEENMQGDVDLEKKKKAFICSNN